MTDEDHSPPGWDNHPSSWGQRIPIVVLAIVGVAVSGYLALFQLNIIGSVWEPVFGDGSRVILIFGLAVGPLGAISILLVVLQPVLLDAWCTLCLVLARIVTR